MQTLYYTTRNFVRSEGNLVDLSEYRRRLKACSGYDGAVEPAGRAWDTAEDEDVWETAEAGRPAEQAPFRPAVRRRRRQSFFAVSNLPELCATLAIVVMAVTAIIRFVQF